jgi:hypothetical protein
MTDAVRPSGRSPASSRANRSLVVRIAVSACVSAIVAVSAALVAIQMTRPTDRELRRAAAEELGLPARLLDMPGAESLVDEVTGRVARRVIAESRPSLATGLIAGTLAGVVSAVACAAALTSIAPRSQAGDMGKGPS